MRILLTLPAYNEEHGLPQVLGAFQREVLAAGYEGLAVIVDDGSTDGTDRVIREWSAVLPIELVRHPVNRGLGETIEDGLRRAAELARPEDVVVTMDADHTHSPALIPQMIRRLDEGHDVIIASRYRPGSKVLGLSGFRHLMSYGARLLFQALCPIPGVRDYTCGFRAYRARVLQAAFTRHNGKLVRERGFAAMAEILLKLGAMRVRMAEAPMVLRYDRKAGPGKMKVALTVAKTLQLVIRNRFKGA